MRPISICYTSSNITIRILKVKVSYKILERILANSRYFGKQKHSCRHKFSREFCIRCAFSVNLLSTFVNLKTGCKPDVQRVLTTCQPITQKNSSIKREKQKLGSWQLLLHNTQCMFHFTVSISVAGSSLFGCYDQFSVDHCQWHSCRNNLLSPV